MKEIKTNIILGVITTGMVVILLACMIILQDSAWNLLLIPMCEIAYVCVVIWLCKKIAQAIFIIKKAYKLSLE